MPRVLVANRGEIALRIIHACYPGFIGSRIHTRWIEDHGAGGAGHA